MGNTQEKCRLVGCREDHTEHYCRLCQQKPSDHFSRDCLKGTVLYHGTNIDVIKPIALKGFKESGYGRLGPGVYLLNRKRRLVKSA